LTFWHQLPWRLVIEKNNPWQADINVKTMQQEMMEMAVVATETL